MEKHFNVIKQTYADFHRSLLAKGRLPMKDTGIGFWSSSDPEELFAICKRLKLDQKKSFLDLGSGDGVAVMVASLFTDASGIEIDPWLHEVATDIQDKLSSKIAQKEVTLHQGNYMDHSLAGHDVVYLCPDRPLWRGIEQKLKEELDGTLVVHGHHFHPRGLQEVDSFTVKDTLVKLYRR